MTKAILFLAWVCAMLALLALPAYAHDCSGAADCALVVHGSGLIAALLGLLLGAGATASAMPKEYACRYADATLKLLKVLLVAVGILVLVAIILLLLGGPLGAAAVRLVAFLMFLIILLLAIYYLLRRRCNDP